MRVVGGSSPLTMANKHASRGADIFFFDNRLLSTMRLSYPSTVVFFRYS